MISINSPADFESAKIPTGPGVYLYKDETGTIIYCGKAKNLRSRVKNYFQSKDIPIKTQLLVSKIKYIDWIVVDSEVEALLLENKLIKQHTPKYNISLKDAKTFAYIAFTKEDFPRIISTRKPSSRLDVFGPYTDGTRRAELQRLLVQVFKIRTCKTLPKRACLNYRIGICTAPCILKVTADEYSKQVALAKSFLDGKTKETLLLLEDSMKKYSVAKKYERALEIRNQIASIEMLADKQVVDTEKRFDQDVIAFRRHGDAMLVVQFGVRKGVLLGKKEFSVDFEQNVEQAFLKAFYATHEIPREILLNTEAWIDDAEKKSLEDFFTSMRGAPVILSIPERGNNLSLVKLAEKNIESTLSEDSALVDLQTALNLPSLPKVIECFDISNLGDEHIVSGMTRFVDMKPDTAGYRRFKMKTVHSADDFASMKEVVYRRYAKIQEENGPLPDLVVIDGGLGQLGAAREALKLLGLQLPIIGLAKRIEEVYVPGEQTPYMFDKNSRMMLLLRRIRDATHNYAVGYNRKRREMKMREEFKEQKR